MLTVFGSTGMLGSMLVRIALDYGFEVTCIDRHSAEFDAKRELSCSIRQTLEGSDLVVNCVAITRCMDNVEDVFRTNAWFPRHLERVCEQAGKRLVHVSTDAVFRGRTPAYRETEPHDAEDIYGVSKSLGEPVGNNALSIRCSIVGTEGQPRGHLLEWFLAHSDEAEVSGFVDHLWHGATTLQLARFILEFADKDKFDALRAATPAVHFTPNAPLTKFDLLKQINEVFGRNIRIKPIESDAPRCRTLSSSFARQAGFEENGTEMVQALEELRSYGKKGETRK